MTARSLLALSSLLSLLNGCAAVLSRSAATSGAPAAALVASIPTGKGPTMLAMAPDGSRVYAAGNGTLWVISTAGNSVIARVPIDPNTVAITVTPDGTRALISSLFSTRLTVVDTVTNTILAPLDLVAQRIRGGYGRIGLSPDGHVAYLPNQANQTLIIANTDGSGTDMLLMNMRPRDVAVSPDGRQAYLCGCKDFCSTGSVLALDTQSRLFGNTFAVGPQPYRIALSSDGRRAYTINLGAASLSVVDLPGGAALATVPVQVEPTGLAISADGAWVYVTSQTTGHLTVINGATYAVQATVKVGDVAREVVLSPDGRRAYVSTAKAVAVIDTGALTAAPAGSSAPAARW